MESKEALKQYVQTEEGAKDQNAWYKLGSIYRKEENWGRGAQRVCQMFGTGCIQCSPRSHRIHQTHFGF